MCERRTDLQEKEEPNSTVRRDAASRMKDFRQNAINSPILSPTIEDDAATMM